MSQRLDCEVLVVGAGPAGAELARLLAQAGVDVVLVDRLADLRQAAFSSAALPLEALTRFGLPASVVAARWRGWAIVGPNQQHYQWIAERPLGAVLDFGALRLWLADQAQAWGAALRLGWTALGCESLESGLDSGMVTSLRRRDGHTCTLTSRYVVDASGEGRALLGDPADSNQALVTGLGVEWLLQVPQPLEASWRDRLSFFLGTQWLPQGYGWIFPMAPGQLKVGVCRLRDDRQRQPPLTTALQRLLDASGLQQAQVIDRHGGRIRSSINRRELHYRGRLLGLGDVVSTANLLGGEGIRHALTSARVLAPLLQEALAHPSRSEGLLQAYPGHLRHALGRRWNLSGRLARRTWLGLVDGRADRRLERLLTGLQTKRAEDLSALLFDYRFERYGLKALPYLFGWR